MKCVKFSFAPTAAVASSVFHGLLSRWIMKGPKTSERVSGPQSMLNQTSFNKNLLLYFRLSKT